jgi:hypothetical protein
VKTLLGRLLGESYLERELEHVAGTIAATEADIRFILEWIATHPEDPHVPEYRFLLRVDERTLRQALRRRENLQRRKEWIDAWTQRREGRRPPGGPRAPGLR